MSNEIDYAPRRKRPAPEENGLGRQEKQAQSSPDDYRPQSPRHERAAKKPQPSYWERAAQTNPRSARRGGKPDRKVLWRLIALGALIVLVVPSVMVALVDDDATTQDPYLATLIQRLQEDPEDFNTLVNLGVYFDEQGVNAQDIESALAAFQSAAGYYERALRVKPDDSDVRTDLGRLYYYEAVYTGDTTLYDQAISTLQLALSSEPDKPMALFWLGAIYDELGQVDQALVYWQRVVEVAPGTEAATQAQQLIDEYNQ